MPDSSATADVALFPIPDLVAFPGTVVPLHVFEPRYRQLIRDSVRDRRLVAVSHTIKPIHQPGKTQSLEQTLRSNQATYKPHAVFSAGYCEILETTSDGRIIASVGMSTRLALLDDIQLLPYRVVSCTPVTDEETHTPAEDRVLQASIHDLLIALVDPQNPGLADELRQPRWLQLSPGEYSFLIFQFLRFDADTMQHILESTRVNERLEMIWDVVRRG